MIYLLSALISITHIWHAEHNIISVFVWYTIFTPALCMFSAYEKKQSKMVFIYLLALSSSHYAISHLFFNLNYNAWLVIAMAVLSTLACNSERSRYGSAQPNV